MQATRFLNRPAGFICMLIFCAPVWAAEPAVTKPGAAMLQTLLGLALVIGLIFALAWLSKRLGGALPGNSKIMKILAVLPVGPREKIVLVEVGGQQMMLGVTPGQINTLQIFAEPVVKPPEVGGMSAGGISRDGSPGQKLAARTASEFSKKLHEFLNQGNKS